MTETDGSDVSSVLDFPTKLQAQVLSLSDGEASGLIYIEQFDAGAECAIPNRPYLQGINDDLRQAMLFRPACKTWACPVCGQVNKRRWIARAIIGTRALVEQGQHVGFLTLTSHEKLRGEASFRVFPAAWMKLQARWRRSLQNGVLAAYFAVPERHKDGTLHTHLIITGDMPERWWKDNARACGMGYMADLQEVVDLGVGGYVGKYLGKTLDDKWPPKKRRVNTARAWPELPVLDGMAGWTFSKIPVREPLNVRIAQLERDGYDVVLTGGRRAWALLASEPGDCL